MDAHVALATCAAFPDLDDDGPFLRSALEARGIRSTAAVWNDQLVDWDAFDLVVIRSTFDYAPLHHEFAQWAQAVPRLANPAAVVTANLDKGYLFDLEAQGIAIPPSTSVTALQDFVVPDGRFVVKPAIGNGGRGAALFGPGDGDLARTHVGGLLATGVSVLCQEYLEQVEISGETALIYLGGTFSHALRKPAILTELQGRPARHDDMTPRDPSDEELALAQAALDASGFKNSLLYARVDLLRGPAGPVAGELELIEPMLYLTKSPGAVDRFADAIGAWLSN